MESRYPIGLRRVRKKRKIETRKGKAKAERKEDEKMGGLKQREKGKGRK